MSFNKTWTNSTTAKPWFRQTTEPWLLMQTRSRQIHSSINLHCLEIFSVASNFDNVFISWNHLHHLEIFCVAGYR